MSLLTEKCVEGMVRLTMTSSSEFFSSSSGVCAATLYSSARFLAAWKGQPVPLTRSEFQLLLLLARRRGLVLSREQLLDLCRGDDVVVTDRTIDTFIKRLRKKLRQADPAFDAIETVFGIGYRYRP